MKNIDETARLTNDSLRRNLVQNRQNSLKRSQWAIQNMGCCLLSEAASRCSPKYASCTHTCLVRCEVDSEWPILNVPSPIQDEQRKGHPQCHHSPGHLITMILSNDPQYGSHLAGDPGQVSILQMLIEDVSEGQLVVGRRKMIHLMTSNSSIHETGTLHVAAQAARCCSALAAIEVR
jgi:hypothetical protein